MTGVQSDERSLILAAQAMASAAEQAIAKGAIVWEADVTITYNSALALNLTPRTAPFAISTAKVGDRIYAHRKALPKLGGVNLLAGILIEGTGFVPVDGTVEIYHVIPAVGLNQTLTIPLHLVAYRTITT